MIYCPNCGTSNRKGSRFCSECGESLPRTGTRCPMCGTVNPVSNVYCQECTARLVPMTSPPGEQEEGTQPIKGISLPTIPLDEEEQDEEEPSPISEQESASEDWLDELRESADETDEGEEQRSGKQIDKGEEAPEPAEIPDWLHEMGPVGGESQAPRTAIASSWDEDSEEETTAEEKQREEDIVESVDVSEQGRDLGTPGDELPEGETPAETGDEAALEPAEIPNWLSDLREEQQETSSASGEEALATDELPGEEQGPGESEAEQPSAGQSQTDMLHAEEPKLEELPEWLEETALPGAEAKREPSSESVTLPSWLQQVEGDAERTPPEDSPEAFTETRPEAFDPPEWLRELMEGSPVEEETAPSAVERMLVGHGLSETLRRADIPAWLQELRPSEPEREEAPGGAVETEGLLKGLRGLIPASRGLEPPASYEIKSGVATSEATRARAELLQSLLGEPHSKPKPDVAQEHPDIGPLVERWLVAVVLLFSVLGMLLAPLMTGEVPRLTQPMPASGATQLYEIVNGLNARDSVLVAFDYGPPEVDELNRVAQPILEHLIESGASPSIVSTRPDGPPVAAALIGKIADSSDQYTLLGYRPGAGIAVSQLLAAAEEPPTLLLVLTSRPGPLLRWIEQARALYGDQLQVAVASSALLEPVTSPYLDTNAGQLSAAIHGLRGAASYEALRGARGEASQRLDTLAAGHVAIVALMLIGAAVYGLGGFGGRQT